MVEDWTCRGGAEPPVVLSLGTSAGAGLGMGTDVAAGAGLGMGTDLEVGVGIVRGSDPLALTAQRASLS